MIMTRHCSGTRSAPPAGRRSPGDAAARWAREAAAAVLGRGRRRRGPTTVPERAGDGAGAAAGAAAPARRLEPCDALLERLQLELAGGAADPHQRELQRQSRVGALAHLVVGVAQQVDEPVHVAGWQPVGLGLQPRALVVGRGDLLGRLAQLLAQEERAQVAEQVGDQRGRGRHRRRPGRR